VDTQSVTDLLDDLTGWTLLKTGGENLHDAIYKAFMFKNFRSTMNFLNRIAETAESEGHHPDFCVHYNEVEFTIWTHAINGLHENDFILAAKIDEISEEFR